MSRSGTFGFRIEGGTEYNKLPMIKLDPGLHPMVVDSKSKLETGDEIIAINGLPVASTCLCYHMSCSSHQVLFACCAAIFTCPTVFLTRILL